MKTKSGNKLPEKPAPAGKYIGWLYLAALSLLFLFNYTAIFDEKVDMNGDNIYYYSLGKALSDGKGFSNTIGFDESPHSHFPPGYPAFIALLMKAGFTGVHAVKTANGALLFLSMLLLFFVLRSVCRNRFVAFTATAFTVSQTTILRFATIMMSEMLFLFFTLVLLLIILEWKPEKAFTDRKKRWKDTGILLLLLLSFGYIYLIRSMGMALILAVLLYFGIKSLQQLLQFLKNKNTGQRAVMFRYVLVTGCLFIAFLVPKTAWDIRNKSIGKATSDYVSDFNKKENGQVMEGVADWTDRILNNTRLYITEWLPSAVFSYAGDLHHKAGTGDWIKGISLLLLMATGLYGLPRGRLLLLLYTGITMGVLLVWPEQYGGQRYMLPVIPFLIFLTLYGCVSLLRLLATRFLPSVAKKQPALITVTACALFSLIAYPGYAESIKGMKLMSQYKEYTAEIAGAPLAEYIEAMRWVKDNIGGQGRILTRKPELFYIYSGGLKSISFPHYATPEEIIAYLTDNQIRFIIIDRWFRHAYVTLIPAVQQYQRQFRVLHQIGGGNANEPGTYILEFRQLPQ